MPNHYNYSVFRLGPNKIYEQIRNMIKDKITTAKIKQAKSRIKIQCKTAIYTIYTKLYTIFKFISISYWSNNRSINGVPGVRGIRDQCPMTPYSVRIMNILVKKHIKVIINISVKYICIKKYSNVVFV